MKKWKKLTIWLAAALAVIAFLASPPAAALRSVAVMWVYSAGEKKASVQAERGIDIEIPSGRGWHPLVMTFNADELFESFVGQEGAKLTIMYDFPAFDPFRGCSRLFDEKSPYYSSFYGAYLVSLPEGGAYGFDNKGLSLEDAAARLARLDFFGLVLGDFGLERDERVFEYAAKAREEDLDFAGSSGWTRLDGTIRINGMAHEALPGVRAYWQYGRPNFPVSESFAPVDMTCTVFARYFEQWDTSIYFYVMARDAAVCDACVENILGRSVIKAE